MSSLALSFVFALTTLAPADSQISPKERTAWRSLQPAIATIVRGGQDVGTAALVDSKGQFLTHLGAVQGKRIRARLADGSYVGMSLKASDEPTQLAILQADNWIRSATPMIPVDGELKAGDRLLAILPSGLIRAEFVSSQRMGLVAPSRRLMALSEIRFEAPADSIGGALVVTPQGKVVGFLNATLRNEQLQNQTVQPIQAPQGQEGVAPMVKRAARAMANNLSQARFGPADMTVAYTTAPSSLQRALNSLLRGQDVIRPSIGVDVRNSQEGGALIESVDQGSEAEQAGLKKGDVVIEINGKRIQDQMDLAQAVMEQQPGATLVVKVKRGRALLTVPVRVGQKRSKTLASPGDAT